MIPERFFGKRVIEKNQQKSTKSIQSFPACKEFIRLFSAGYGISTDGTTTYINAATCDERYAPINPPVVFDLPVPPGYTKDGSLRWLIRNEPWKNKTKTSQRIRNGLNRDVDDIDDEIVFEASGDSPIIGRNKSSHKNDFDMQRFEVIESQLSELTDSDNGSNSDDSDNESIEDNIDSPVMGKDKSSNENFDVKKVQMLQSELSDSDNSIVFEESEPKSSC